MPRDAKRPEAFSLYLPWVILAFGAVTWGVLIYHTHFQLEDALITYRYSANLVAGRGFVFNPGEHVLGTTTPLVTLFLALVSLPFGPHSIREVATVVMPVFGLLTGLVAYFALRQKGIAVAAAGLAMCFLYIHIELIRTGIGGMETPVVLMLMGLSLWALGRERAVLMGVFCGLLILCRIDGAIWVGMVMLATALKSWRKSGVAALTALAVMLPWIVFATLYFGSFLPNSMLAKAVVRPGREGLLLNGHNLYLYAIWYLKGTGFKGSFWLLPLWFGALGIGAWRLIRQDRKNLWPIVVFPFVYAVTMYVGRAPRFEWYLLPITYCCMIWLGVGIVGVCRWIGAGIPVRARVPIALLTVAAAMAWYVGIGVPMMIKYMCPRATTEDWVRTEVGKWLHGHTPKDSLVVMEAIGYQGYYSERRIVDIPGLVSPKVVEFKRKTASNGKVFDEILHYFKPDYIVLRCFEVDENQHFNGGRLFLTPEKEKEFHDTYREVRRFHGPGCGPRELLNHLTVYQRNVMVIDRGL